MGRKKDFIDGLIDSEKQKRSVEDAILYGNEDELKREYRKYIETLANGRK